MQHDLIIFAIFLVFTGAAVIGSLALFARQSLLVAYILVGALLGPWGLGWVTDAALISEIGHIGIIFLLFLLGLSLQASNLIHLLREATLVTVASCLAFAALGYAVVAAFGFGHVEAMLVGAMMMFSSTIIGLKLLPTTALHHQHTGEVMVSILLLQDIIAIIILLMLQGLGRGNGGLPWMEIGLLALTLPALTGLAVLGARFVLVPLITRFDTIQEYIFLLTIGWCLGVAQLSVSLGLSHEIGAFIAGVALATSPIAMFITESLKPLRDFFLVMFFFALGAGFELPVLHEVIWPALGLAGLMLLAKPLIFERLLIKNGETPKLSREVGFRLGQVSEFSLMIAVLAVNAGVIGLKASYLVQAATLITFIVSSYLIMLRYPTPIAVSAKLRRD